MGTFGRSMVILSWIATFVMAGFAGVVLIFGMSTAQSAPQEAVVCALACAIAIIPYCVARAVTEIAKASSTPDNGSSDNKDKQKVPVKPSEYNYLKLG